MISGKRIFGFSSGLAGVQKLLVTTLMAFLLLFLTSPVGRTQEQATVEEVVARVSLVAGEVSYQRASESESNWYDATINLPLGASDQLQTGPDGRVEIQVGAGNTVRLSRDSNLRFTDLSQAQFLLSLPVGTMTVRIENLDVPQGGRSRSNGATDADERPVVMRYEVGTPAASITLNRKGVYRFNVAADGTTEIVVRSGQVEIFRQEIGSFMVEEGRTCRVDGTDPTIFAVTATTEVDDEWDRWNGKRDDEIASLPARAADAPIPQTIPGSADLDRYGEWIDTPEYGQVWAPRGVDTAWAPYRLGYWRWYAAYGWTWISHEPWGWVPYHYGRWAWYRQRWFWVPYRGQVGNGLIAAWFGLGWRWSPHLVAFIGWGEKRYLNGYRDGFRDGYWTGFADGRGWLGWCPLAPGEDRHDWRGERAVGRLEQLRNYQMPGGVSGIEGSRFINGRVVQLSTNLVVPPRNAGAVNSNLAGIGGPVRESDLQPGKDSRPVRTPLIERIESRRTFDVSRPIIVRREYETTPKRNPSTVTDPVGSRPIRSNVPTINPPARSVYTIPRSGNVPRRETDRVDQTPPSAPRRDPIPSRPAIITRPWGAPPAVEIPRRQTSPPPRSIPPRVQSPSPPASPTAPSRGPEPTARPERQATPERPQRPISGNSGG